MFVGSAVRVSFIFVEVIGEALDLFAFSKGRWQIDHMFLDKFLRIRRMIECFFRMQVKVDSREMMMSWCFWAKMSP